jgi:hypothetical protein
LSFSSRSQSCGVQGAAASGWSGELEGEQLPQPLLMRDGRAAETVDQRASDGGVDGRDEFEP